MFSQLVRPAFCKKMVLICLGLCPAISAYADYSSYEDAQLLMDEMVQEEGFDRAWLESLFSQVEKKQSIIDAMNRPAERVLTWADYRKIFIRQTRIDGGVEFWRKNQAVLEAAEDEFGVPAEIIVSIIGVETSYGGNTGSYRVMDALSTLAFDYPRRAPFFRSELKHFLILARDQDQDPLLLKGSYAGAMGLGQFMPSSYRAYAADYDQDGFIDIWQNESDAIWSVASYLSIHGWDKDEGITHPAVVDNVDEAVINQSRKPELTLADLRQSGIWPNVELPQSMPATAMSFEGEQGTEYWVGLNNFYVITRYNTSTMYALAVYQLAEDIRIAKQSS